jgi:FkbM family methyltransferase
VHDWLVSGHAFQHGAGACRRSRTGMAMSLGDRILRRTYGRRRFQPVYRRVHDLALAGLNYGYVDAALNGEHAFIDRLARQWQGRPVVAFDVGAFHGTWTAALLQRVSSATVHAFEPVASSFAQLSANIGAQAHVHRCALGAAIGTAEMFAPPDADGSLGELASLHARDLSGFALAVEPIGKVQVRTLDEFCDEQGITHIDLLKLDTEGHELPVLTGASRLLGRRAIDAIQFEFGGANIDSRTFLRDIVDVLRPAHAVYRLLKDGVEPLRNDEREEIFTYANYIAVRA